ncbi:MAG: MaoC/PaaZ C-terminal domain-containing protein [Syntrophales bacterium]|jgi:putative sterol carrier protein/acyl dehydratase
MPLNVDAIGKKIGPLTKEYTWKDVILYALGIGAGFHEIDYAYEKRLKVIPTFSIAMIFDFFREVAAASHINIAGVLHVGQDIIFHNPIPSSGTMITEGMITNYYDKGTKGALVVARSETSHSDAKKLFTSIMTLFGRLDGGFGGKNAPHEILEFPDRDPDFVVEATPSPDQPLLYRLSGDTFGLHVDTEFAKMVGFEKPIMHGLCTYGFACRALMKSLTPSKPEHVRRLACRFLQALYPGEPIKTLVWRSRDGEAVWRTIHAITGDVVIDRGIFEYGEVPSAEEGMGGHERMTYSTGDNLPTSGTKEDRPAVGAETGGNSMVKAIFEKMPSVFNADAAQGVDVVFQFSISGEGGGDWYAEVKGGACKVEAGVHPSPTSTIKMDAADFVDMINGKLPAMQAFTSGKLKIGGDIMKSQLIMRLFKF